jgi:ribonuclease PH
VQGTAEGAPYTRTELDLMLDMAEQGIRRLVALQTDVVAS